MILGYRLNPENTNLDSGTVSIYSFPNVQERIKFLGAEENEGELIATVTPVQYAIAHKLLSRIDGDWGRLTSLNQLFGYGY